MLSFGCISGIGRYSLYSLVKKKEYISPIILCYEFDIVLVIGPSLLSPDKGGKIRPIKRVYIIISIN